MKKIKWQKARKRKLWIVPQFPFFNLSVKYDEYQAKSNYPPYCARLFFGTIYCWTLEEAQSASIKSVYENLQKIKFHHTYWCNNNGNGKYIKERLHEKFQWLECGYNHTSSLAKRHAIRFGIETPYEDVIKHGEKIIERHKKRFISALETLPTKKPLLP